MRVLHDAQWETAWLCRQGHNLHRVGTYPDLRSSGALYLRCRECNKQRAKARQARIRAEAA